MLYPCYGCLALMAPRTFKILPDLLIDGSLVQVLSASFAVIRGWHLLSPAGDQHALLPSPVRPCSSASFGCHFATDT